MLIDWLHMLDEYWDEKDTTYSYDFDLLPDCLYKYFNELPFSEAIGSDYITWKSEQHILTTKYDILRSLALLVKHYFMTMN